MNKEHSIALIGAGAIGGCTAAALGDAGHRVQLCVRTPFGQLVRTLDGERTQYAHPVVTDPSSVQPVDWVMLCTKAHQIAEAAHWLRALIGPRTRIAVLQNGVDHAERVVEWISADRVVPCIVLLPAVATAPGQVEQARAANIQVPDNSLGRACSQLFAGQQAINIKIEADFISALWLKLVFNAVGGAICSLTLKPLGAMAAPQVKQLVSGMIEEVVAVGRAEGATLSDSCAEDTITYFQGPIRSHWTSMAQDRHAGRLMEWEARNAVVGRVARRHGIATPFNDAMTALLSLVDDPAY
jgi:2-dehydropantoate 2-reductase